MIDFRRNFLGNLASGVSTFASIQPLSVERLRAMWERTLQDLIRGLRAHKNDEALFIARAIDEIREEVRSKDMELKAAAVLKLTYVCVSLCLLPQNIPTDYGGQATHDGL